MVMFFYFIIKSDIKRFSWSFRRSKIDFLLKKTFNNL